MKACTEARASFFRAAAAIVAVLTIGLTWGVATPAIAATVSSVPGSVGQNDGRVTIGFGLSAWYFELIAPSGVLISRPATSYSCTRTDTGVALPAGDTSLVPGIRCEALSVLNQPFGTYVIPTHVNADQTPGTNIGNLSYRLVNRAGSTIDSGAVMVTALPLETPTVESPAPEEVLTTSRPTISGTAPTLPGTARSVVVRDSRTGTALGTAAIVDDSWFLELASELPQGTNTLSAFITLNGAESATVDRSFIIDSVAPAPPTFVTPRDGDVISDRSPALAGISDPGTLVSVRDGGGEIVCTSETAADGTWSCQPSSPFPEGIVLLYPIAEDTAGNSTTGAAISVTIDVTRPQTPVIDCIREVDNTVICSGSAEPGTRVAITDSDGRALCTVDVRTDGTWNCVLPTNALGPVRATATDGATNISEPAFAQIPPPLFSTPTPAEEPPQHLAMSGYSSSSLIPIAFLLLVIGVTLSAVPRRARSN